MRRLSIRVWLILSLLVFIFAAALPFPLVANYFCRGDEFPSGSLTAATHLLAANVARWADPAWQKGLAAQLPPGTQVVLTDGSREIFRAGPAAVDTSRPAQLVITKGTQVVGVADIYDVTPCGGQIYVTLAIPLSLLTQLVVALLIIWLLYPNVLRPLAAMSRAARQVAAGNLDFDLPASRVREVDEVAAAFHAMGDALRASLTRQAEIEQERRFFVGAIAHDLRTPLFALRGYLSGLERGLANTPEKAAHYLAVCQEKADALEDLIAGLFAYTRLEYLEQAPVRAPLDFGRLAAQALEDVRLRAQERGIALTLEAGAGPGTIPADGALLARALGNLLDNALRYTPDGGAIALSWHVDDHGLTFSVADSGPGIDPRDLPHLFDPLYRGETSRSRETGGAGLGLTIARRILLAHGGELAAANRPGGGAEFTGTLPISGLAV
jgi:signal transduction histidine kinase